MKNNHTSEYQVALETFRKLRCLTCNGCGFTTAQQPSIGGFSYHKEMQCSICKGTGFKPLQGKKKS